MPDGTSRFSTTASRSCTTWARRTFSEYTVVPEISLAKINPEAPLDKVCLLGCGITTGIGAVLNTAKVSRDRRVAVFGLGGIGLSVVQGAVMAKAGRIIAVDINPTKFEMAKRSAPPTSSIRRTTTGRSQQVIVELTDGGVDYSFRVHRQRQRHARGARVLPQGLGRIDHHRRRRRRRRRSARGRSSSSPAACGAAPPSAASRAARNCRATSSGTCAARSRSTR